MAGSADPSQFKEALIVLGAAAVVIPVFLRLKVSPIIGFIAVGMLVGPFGLGAVGQSVPWLSFFAIEDREEITALADWGVVLLLFMIGLELSWERLKALRRLVFGLGPAQTLASTAAIAGAALAFGQPPAAALVLGFGLAISSTAVVIQVLSQERRLASPTGRASLGVLLFQDVAVAPALFAIGILGAPGLGATGGAFAVAMGTALAAVAAVLIVGRIVLRPLFRSVARTQSPELFVAACLLVILGAGVATAAAGLSMTMGALLAGILLAETEYRRQIEVLVEPFKGLLLGVFLISVGMAIDLSLLAVMPVAVLGATAALIAGKALIVWLAAPLFGVARGAGLSAALLLAPAGEFTFVIVGAAMAAGLIAGAPADFALLLAALTMALIPAMSALGRRLTAHAKAAAAPAEEPPPEDAPRVLIAGYGRVGQVVGSLLEAHDVPYLAVDRDADTVARARRQGKPVYFGDLASPDFLHRCGVGTARALVVTMDSAALTEEVVRVARTQRQDLIIVARARDARHAGKLYAKGASDAVPETTEASLLLGEAVLVDIGVPMGLVIASIHDKRAAFRAEMQAASVEPDRPPLPVRTRSSARLSLKPRAQAD